MRKLGRWVRSSVLLAKSLLLWLSKILAIVSLLVLVAGAIFGSYLGEELMRQMLLPVMLTLWASTGICGHFDRRIR